MDVIDAPFICYVCIIVSESCSSCGNVSLLSNISSTIFELTNEIEVSLLKVENYKKGGQI